MFFKEEEFTYFKALCLKKLRKFDEAEKVYKSIAKQLRLSEGKKLI